MRVAYFDCLASVSAEMLLGALLEVGLSLDELRQGLISLPLPVHLSAERVMQGGVRATRVALIASDHKTKGLAEIASLLESAALPEPVIAEALRIFRRWAEAEARARDETVDGCPWCDPADIVAVVGVLLGLRRLQVDEIWVSSLPVGQGALLPRAVTELLEGFAVRSVRTLDPQTDLLTPAATAILTTLAARQGPIPPMTVERVGYGAGNATLPIPNVLRLWLGETEGEGLELRTLLMVETNIDDMDPEFYEHVMAQLFAEGALDVGLLPMQMKKNRPATLLRVLCAPEKWERVRHTLFRETTTLGVRVQEVQRFALPRRMVEVETPWGKVRVKIARLPDGTERPIPEYEDCRRLAESASVPLWRIYQAAQAAIIAA